MSTRTRSMAVPVVALLLIASASASPAQTPDAQLAHLADRFVAQELAYDPTIAYFTGLTAPTTHANRFADRRPKALAAFDDQERQDLAELGSLHRVALSPASHATFASLREQLQADLQLRVCRTELWDVNHFDGWQSQLGEVAARQPVASPAERRDALERWRTLPAYIDVEIANLRLGLAQGYSAPQSVVRRVIAQMDDLTAGDPARSPFFSPAQRSSDPAFQARFRALLVGDINPALHRYRDFLQTVYLPRARPGIAISDLPNGPACYQAFLRANTTLNRTPQQVFDLGQKTVNANIAAVQQLGQKDYGSSDIPVILAAIKKKPGEHFRSSDDLLDFSRAFLARAKGKTAASLVERMPKQDVVIRPLPAFEDAAGAGSRFEPEPDPRKPSAFVIQLSVWPTETRAEAEIVTVHETTPGHYLQKSLARELQPPTNLSKLIDNSAYSEGWARYAEGMGEEAGIYDTEDAAILRRLWPARGMVVDPGLHAFHWTRQQAIDYILAAGRDTPQSAADLIDRIAVMPGQLTSYDSGGLENLALRSEAETRLGARFDLRRFNQAVLEEGVVPLPELRAHVESWITEQSAPAKEPPR